MMFEYTNPQSLTESLNPERWKECYPELEIFKKYLVVDHARQSKIRNNQIYLQQGYQQLGISLGSLGTVLFINILLDQNSGSSKIRIQTRPALMVLCALVSMAVIRYAKKSLETLKKMDEAEREKILNYYKIIRQMNLKKYNLLYAFFAIAGIYLELQKIQSSISDGQLESVLPDLTFKYTELTSRLRKVLQSIRIPMPELDLAQSGYEFLDQIDSVKSYLIFLLHSATFESILSCHSDDIEKQIIITEIIGVLGNTHFNARQLIFFEENAIRYGCGDIERTVINYHRDNDIESHTPGSVINPHRLESYIHHELVKRIGSKPSVEKDHRPVELADAHQHNTSKRVTTLYSYLTSLQEVDPRLTRPFTYKPTT